MPGPRPGNPARGSRNRPRFPARPAHPAPRNQAGQARPAIRNPTRQAHSVIRNPARRPIRQDRPRFRNRPRCSPARVARQPLPDRASQGPAPLGIAGRSAPVGSRWRRVPFPAESRRGRERALRGPPGHPGPRPPHHPPHRRRRRRHRSGPASLPRPVPPRGPSRSPWRQFGRPARSPCPLRRQRGRADRGVRGPRGDDPGRGAGPAAGDVGLGRGGERQGRAGLVQDDPADRAVRDDLQVNAVKCRDVLLDGEQFERPARAAAPRRARRSGSRSRATHASASALGLRGGTTSPVPPMTSTTAPTSVETVARPQSMASTRPAGKPSTTLERTTTAPAAYASGSVGVSGAPISWKETELSPTACTPSASSGKSCAASARQWPRYSASPAPEGAPTIRRRAVGSALRTSAKACSRDTRSFVGSTRPTQTRVSGSARSGGLADLGEAVGRHAGVHRADPGAVGAAPFLPAAGVRVARGEDRGSPVDLGGEPAVEGAEQARTAGAAVSGRGSGSASAGGRRTR